MADVFVSYSRRNQSFAERLHHDLVRAGLSVWRDTADIPSHSDAWWEEIRRAIAECSHFVLLVSPETLKSEVVEKELAEARTGGKPIHRILVGGEYDQLPDAWKGPQVTNFQGDYWKNLRRLLAQLGAPRTDARSLFDLLRGPAITVEAAAAELGEATLFHVGEHRFVGLPVEPSGYTMTRLIGPADAQLRSTGSLAVLLGFTGDEGTHDAQAVLDFWVPQGESPWLLWVDGPVNEKKKHELSGNHVWKDALDSTVRACTQLGKGRSMSLFFCCPVTLAFAVGARLRQMSPYRVYNYWRGKNGEVAYEMVLHLDSSP